MTYPADRSGIQRADGGSPVIPPSSTDLARKPAVPLTEMRIAIVISDPGVTSAIIGRGMMKLLASARRGRRGSRRVLDGGRLDRVAGLTISPVGRGGPARL